MSEANTPRKLYWVGDSKSRVRAFPDRVRQEVGFGLYIAQLGDKHPDAKPLRGFAGASVLELIENHDGDAYRAVYTVRFKDSVYVLHAFQKKSKHGIATPPRDLEKISQRLREAELHYESLRKQGA